MLLAILGCLVFESAYEDWMRVEYLCIMLDLVNDELFKLCAQVAILLFVSFHLSNYHISIRLKVSASKLLLI